MGLTVENALHVIREPDEFCGPCGAYKTCKTPVMNGFGSESPDYMFIGEAPGATEDEEGIPFVGEAGELLYEAIEAVGILVKKCRFSNVVRCRPPKNNIKYYPNAIEQCRPHILREIRRVRPKVIILLGNSAIQSILNKRGITKLHGEVIDAGLPWKYVCSIHPAYLLRNLSEGAKRKFRQALKVAKNLVDPPKASVIAKKRNHVMVRDRQTLKEMRDLLMKQKYLAHDIEGSTLNAFSRKRKPEIGCVGYAWSDRDACCFPIHSRRDIKVHVRIEEFVEVIKEVNENEEIRHILHFGKYDYVYEAVLEDIWIGGKDNCGYYADTGQMSYVLNERKGGHGLDDWSYRLGMGGYKQIKRQYEMSHPETHGEVGGDANLIPMPILGPYNMDDCIATWRLFWLARKRLKKQNLWQRPFRFPQMWHNWTAAMMEIHGLKISTKRNDELDHLYRERIKDLDSKLIGYPEVHQLQKEKRRELMEEIYLRVKSYKRKPPSVQDKVLELFENAPKKKTEINLQSPEVKRRLIFGILKFQPLWKTKSGKYWSVAKEVLEKLLIEQEKHPIIQDLVDRNELSTAHSKYIHPVTREWMGYDRRTHTNYSPHGQLTGRVSSRDPNHENLPKHNKLAKELRTQFVSSGEDYLILEMDSKQIEMRLFADRANDDIMIEEFNAGKDPHAMGAMAGFEISEEKWLKLPDEKRVHLRFLAKSAISFGLLYGRGAPALAADFGKSVRWAVRFKKRYFGKYDDCAVYIKEREDYILRHGIVYSHFFRPRRLPEVESENEAVVAEAVRQGINSPIQGDASDITWVALHRLQAWLRKHKMRSKAIVAVHDAGYVDTYYKELEDVMYKLREYMIDRDFIERMTGWYCQVPWEVDATLGHDLGNMIEMKRTKDLESFVVPEELAA